VKVVGLGLPNENKRYGRRYHSGVVLWNTEDLGYLTVYAAKACRWHPNRCNIARRTPGRSKSKAITCFSKTVRLHQGEHRKFNSELSVPGVRLSRPWRLGLLYRLQFKNHEQRTILLQADLRLLGVDTEAALKSSNRFPFLCTAGRATMSADLSMKAEHLAVVAFKPPATTPARRARLMNCART
jgi:hypothetical protein